MIGLPTRDLNFLKPEFIQTRCQNSPQILEVILDPSGLLVAHPFIDKFAVSSVTRQADFDGTQSKVKPTKQMKEAQQISKQSKTNVECNAAHKTKTQEPSLIQRPIHLNSKPDFESLESTCKVPTVPISEGLESEGLTAAQRTAPEHVINVDTAQKQALVSSKLQASCPDDLNEAHFVSEESKVVACSVAQTPVPATAIETHSYGDSTSPRGLRIRRSAYPQDVRDTNSNTRTTSNSRSFRVSPSPMSRPLPRNDPKEGCPDPANYKQAASNGQKVTKHTTKRTSSSPHPKQNQQLHRPETDKVISSEQLFKMFMFRRHKEEQQHQLEERQLQEANAQVEKLTTDVATLQHALQQSNLDQEAREVDLLQCRQKLASFKERGVSLQKFVDGLSRDHQKLREDTNGLDLHLRDLTKAKKELESTIAQERSHYNATLKLKLKELTAAREEVMELERQLDDQEQDLVNHNELIDYERQRNDALHEELSAVSEKQSMIIKDVKSNQAAMIARIEALPDASLLTSNLLPSVPPETILEAIQESAALVRALQSRPSISSVDLGRLDNNIKTYAGK